MRLFEIESEHFGGEVKVIRPLVFPDKRGSLVVTYLEDEFKTLGSFKFVRQMYTRSDCNVLRGLHYQLKPPMSKSIQVINGRVYLVAVDIRPDSLTFLKHHAIVASGDQPLIVWASAGFARGYYTLEDNTIVQYNCDAYVGDDRALYWADPDIGIKWPLIEAKPILSDRDEHAISVRELWKSWRGYEKISNSF